MQYLLLKELFYIIFRNHWQLCTYAASKNCNPDVKINVFNITSTDTCKIFRTVTRIVFRAYRVRENFELRTLGVPATSVQQQLYNKRKGEAVVSSCWQGKIQRESFYPIKTKLQEPLYPLRLQALCDFLPIQKIPLISNFSQIKYNRGGRKVFGVIVSQTRLSTHQRNSMQSI